MEEEYQVDTTKLKELHQGLLKSENITQAYIGTEEQFVNYIGNNPEQLRKFWNNVISDGKLNANQLGGSEDAFTYAFLKKKEKGELFSEDSPEPSKSEQTPQEPIEVDQVSIGELKLADWDEITDTDGYGDTYAAKRYNEKLSELVDDSTVTKMTERYKERQNEVKNKIAEYRQKNPINFEERAFKVGGINIIKSETKRGLEELEDELNKEFNPEGYGFSKKELRQSIVHAYEDDVVSNLNSYLETKGANLYTAAVTNPEFLNDWRKYAGKHVFGEMLEPAIDYIQKSVDDAILHNEYTHHTLDKVEWYKSQYNISREEAFSRIEMENVADQRKHLEANMNKKQLDRYRIQQDIDRLAAEDFDGNFLEIYNKSLLLKGENELYDVEGRLLEMPDNEERAYEAQMVNDQIDKNLKQKNFKERLRENHHDNWNIYQNLLRELEKAKKEFSMKNRIERQTLVGEERLELDREKARLEHIRTLTREAKVKVDATGQMLFANENLAKQDARFVMTREFFDTLASTNSNLFPDVTRDRTTPFQKTEAFVEVMAEMGNPLSEEQLDEINWDGAEWVRSGAYFSDIAFKLTAFNKVAGALGARAAIQSVGSKAKLKSASFIAGKGKDISKARRFTAQNIGRLTERAIHAGYEGAAFEVIEDSFKTGALFYGANQALGGIGQAVGKANLGGILKKNNKLGLLFKAMARGSGSMTASMEAVAGVESVIEGWTHDKIIKSELEEMWGAESQWEKRVVMNLALATIMGLPIYTKMARRGLMPNVNEQALDLQTRLFNEGKFELAIEVSNIRGGLMEANAHGKTAEAISKKYDYLIKKGVDPKELRSGKKGDFLIKEINEKFDLMVGDNIATYDAVLGKGSADAALAKKRVLKKLGLPVDNMTLGNIEYQHYSYMHGAEHAKKWNRKVTKETVKEDRRIRKEKLKEFESHVEGLPKYRVDWDAIAANNSTLAEKINKSSRADKSQIEKQIIISNKKVNRDQTKSELDFVSKEYSKMAREKNWDAVKDYVNQALTSANRVVDAMRLVRMDNRQISKMETIRDKLSEAVDSKEVMSGIKFKNLTDKIIDQTQAFGSRNLQNSINEQISSVSKKPKSGGAELQKKNLMVQAFDVMFNKAELQRELNNPKTSETRVAEIQSKLKKYNQIERVIDQVTGNRLAKREALEKIEDSQFKEIERLSKEVDKSIENFETYQGIANAFENAQNRGAVRNRKAEIREASLERKLSESEIVEYEMLSAFDRGTMTNNQLVNAHRTVARIVLEGKSIHASEMRRKHIRKQVLRAEFVRDIYSKALDVETMKIDATKASEINAIMRAFKGARMYIESFTTMMEHMMSGKSGREILTGTGHALSDGLIRANTGEKTSIGKFMNETMVGMKEVFGSTTAAEQMMKGWGMGKRNPKKYDFDIVSGENKSMTIPEAMTFYSYMRQPDQISKLETQGYQIIKDGKLEGISIKSFEKQLTEIAGEKSLEWVQYVTESLLPKVWNVVNERYKIDNGVDLQFLERYFPVFRMREGGSDALVVGDPNNPLPSDYLSSTNKTHLKDRVAGKSEYKLRDFNDVMFEYINTSMHYVHYQGIISEMNTLFKSQPVKDIIYKRFTNQANKSISTLIEDLAAGELRDRGSTIPWMDKARRAFARAKLGFNPTLLPKQAVSESAFMSEMSFAESGKYLTTIPKMSDIKMLMNTPELKNRYRIDEFNRDISERTRQMDKLSKRQVEDRIVLSKGKGVEWFYLKNLRDNQLIATKWGDLGAIVYGGSKFYRIRYDKLRKDGYKHAEAHQMALDAVIRGVERTQQSGAIHNLSMFQRAGSIGKLLTTFQNTPLQYLRVELAALDNMKEALTGVQRGNVDVGKLSSATKTFMVYHFVLPQLFRAASNGFYLGSDKSFLDDPDLFMSSILGSISYAPVAGSAMLSLMSNMNKGYSFGTSQNILSDMLEETDGLLELASDLIMKSDDPAGLTIEYEDVMNAINAVTQWFGIPTASLGTWGKGVYDYMTDRTDNELALLGFSKNVYQGSFLSNDAPEINMFLPENGGNLDMYLEWMRTSLGDGKFEKQKNRLIKEYRIYNKYGFDNSHVNFLYRGTDNAHDQALYLMDMFKSEVEDKWTLRRNYTIRSLIDDIRQGADKTYPEFINYMDDLVSNGVISGKAYEDFMLMLEMSPEEYKEIFDFL